MASIHSVITRMEGMVATMPNTTYAYQSVNTWVEGAKAIMRSTDNRDATNWNFLAVDAFVHTAGNALTGAGTLYGVLVATADDQANWICINDNTTNTFDGSAALDNEDLLALQVPAATTTGTESLHGFLFSMGVAFATGISIGADGLDGTNPGAGDMRAWLLFRG